MNGQIRRRRERRGKKEQEKEEEKKRGEKEEEKEEEKEKEKETSDAGSQYRCGQVGRGIQLPSTPHSPLPTHISEKHL